MAEDADPLGLSPEAMRALGYRTVDMLVEQLAGVRDGPALQRASPAEMRERLPAPPDQPRSFEALVRELERDVLPYMSRCDHPGYFAFIPASGTFPAALGDFIASALNIYAGSWMEAAGPSQLELLVLEAFKQWIGYPEEASGVLVSGGSAANMTALACAREALARKSERSVEQGVAYVSDQAHSSIARAARALGMQPAQLRVLPTDAGHQMRLDALAGAIAADVSRGRTPFFVAASAGSTNTGAIDPLPGIAEICLQAGAWLHIDAAYGGFAALTERGAGWLAGLELADSVTLDPHKWLYQPFECGCVLVREGKRLRAAFEVIPDYLKDAAAHAGEVNFSDLGFQLTRCSRALKVWLSLSYFGVDAFRAAIDRCLDLAAGAERLVRERPELELLSPAQLGIVCFRRHFAGTAEAEWQSARLNAALVGRFEQSGLGLVSSTTLDGRYAIRLCILNHTTTEADVERTIDWFASAPVPPLSDPSAQIALSTADRGSTVTDGWNVGEAFRLQDIADVPLLADLPPDQAARAARWSREVRVAAGNTVVERWDAAREFYVIIDGEAEVFIDDEYVRHLGRGDFFGEVAALDWGSGFGYVRTATVVAASDLRLLVLGPDRLGVLIHACPALGEKLQAAARERMRRM
ncbi:MAG TPA: aminotransferase class V-fold PLP-dependent enzyme [Solirubrobacteraceae bacterium]|nr:aminotransferase class V-fold PLP-dependent enzyme [Solirubrobacteraceae bacterium]